MVSQQASRLEGSTMELLGDEDFDVYFSCIYRLCEARSIFLTAIHIQIKISHTTTDMSQAIK